MSKRYVLFLADRDMGEEEFRELASSLEERRWDSKLIEVRGAPRAVIVRTTAEYAALMREEGGMPSVRGRRLTPVMTSGAVGNLKRRASEAGPMAKFMSEEYVSQVQASLAQDPKWAETSKNFKTSIAFNVTDTGQNYLLTVENGPTTFQKAPPGANAEFAFDGSYDSWCKIAKGEVDIQAAVLKGQLKFKGSITKILAYKDKFVRVAEIMSEVPKEF